METMEERDQVAPHVILESSSPVRDAPPPRPPPPSSRPVDAVADANASNKRPPLDTHEKCAAVEEQLRLELGELQRELKAVREKSAAHEAHVNARLREVEAKSGERVAQLQRQVEAAEKEKGDAVVKYAMREAESMRLSDEKSRLENALAQKNSECNALRGSVEQQQLEQLLCDLQKARVDAESARQAASLTEARATEAERRAEAALVAASDSRAQADQWQKTATGLAEEKALIREQHRVALLQVHDELQQHREQEERRAAEASRRELLCSDIIAENGRLRTDLAAATQTRDALQLSLDGEREVLKQLRERLESLEAISQRVQTADADASEARQKCDAAVSERNAAETDSAACREQAERLLTTNAQLTEMNTSLSTQLEDGRRKCDHLSEEVRRLTDEVDRLSQKSSAAIDNSQKTSHDDGLLNELKQRADSSEREVLQLGKKLQDALAETAALKKRHAASVKELKAELARKQSAAADEQKQHRDKREPSMCRSPSATSLAESGRGGEASSEADHDSRSGFAVDSPHSPPLTVGPSIAGGDDSGELRTAPDSGARLDDSAVSVQLSLVEKIVKLQRRLAKRQEKNEFLTEHVRTLTDELQRKTQLLQHYILREEAALLLPADPSLDKVSLARSSAPSLGLVGGLFSARSSDSKSALQLATEVNAKLQAVLEDTLLKNIALKQSVDSLGETVARMSRENRQLQLAQSRSS